MNSLWARIEPLLARVQKPARYIGCEHGAATPRHAPGKVSWLLAYPDTYEIGLPNQGLQILYEILNERDDAVAERTYAPWSGSDLETQAAETAATVVAQPSVMVERERKGHHAVDDVRAAIEDLSVTMLQSDSAADDPGPHPYAVLATNGRGPRPTELVAALFPALDPVDVTARVLRTHQWIGRDGVRREVIPAHLVASRTLLECA